jgi:hypothetical protein
VNGERRGEETGWRIKEGEGGLINAIFKMGKMGQELSTKK